MTSTDVEDNVSLLIRYRDNASNFGDNVTVTSDSSFITFDRTNPTLVATSISTSNLNPSLGKPGDNITLTFTSSEGIRPPDNLTVDIMSDDVVNSRLTSSDNFSWTAIDTIVATDSGLIDFAVRFMF